MGAHMPVQSERLAPALPPARTGRGSTRPCSWPRGAASRRGPWPRLSPLGSADGLAAVVRRLRERLARRSARNRAVHLLSGLDDRLLADIGLRRADIELAVDGRLADPRVRRQAAMAELLRGQTPSVAGRAGQQQSAGPAATRSRPGGLTDARHRPACSRQRRPALLGRRTAGADDLASEQLCRRGDAPEPEPMRASSSRCRPGAWR